MSMFTPAQSPKAARATAALSSKPVTAALLTQQLAAVLAQSQMLMQAFATNFTATNADIIATIHAHYANALAPYLTAGSSNDRAAALSLVTGEGMSMALIDAMIGNLNYYKEFKGCQAIILTHLQLITAIITTNADWGRSIGRRGVVVAVVSLMKIYAKSRKTLTECLSLLLALNDCQPTTVTADSHPFIHRKFHGVTLYRRLFEILSSPLFRSHRSILTPTMDLLLLLLKLSITASKSQSNTVPLIIEKRLRFGVPSLMEIAYLQVFGVTTLEKKSSSNTTKKMTVRPRLQTSRMFRTLILVLSRLAGLGSLIPLLVKLGLCEWSLEVLKEMRDHPPSVSAIILMLLYLSKDATIGRPTLTSLIGDNIEEKILKYVSPIIEGKIQLFKHTRDLLWNLAYAVVSDRERLKREHLYHFGYNLLNENYFGTSGCDYYVSFDSLKRKRVEMIADARARAGDNDNGDDDSETENDTNTASDDDDETAMNDAERDYVNNIEYEASQNGAARGDEVFDSDDSNDTDNDDTDEKQSSEDSAWMSVEMSASAVAVKRELQSEDTGPEENEDESLRDSGDEADAASPEQLAKLKFSHSEQALQRFRPLRIAYDSDEQGSEMNVSDYCPETWDMADSQRHALSLKHQREVSAAETHSVRFFVPLSESAPSPSLATSTMFSASVTAPPPAAPAQYPEPLYQATMAQYLRVINEYYRESLQSPSVFKPRVVYDRNVLGAYQSMTGQCVDNPLSLFLSDSSLQPSSIPALSFESRFESGNLCRAVQLSDTHYELYLSHDVNTNSHTQWFFFRVTGMRTGVQYRFDIVNLEKKTSAFNKGMRPCLYSEAEAQRSGVGWCRAMTAEKIFYFPNHRVKPPRTKKGDAVAKTPRHSLPQALSLAHSRQASMGAAESNNVTGNGYVDVESLWQQALQRLNHNHQSQSTDFDVVNGVRGEGGVLLQSFLAAEIPFQRTMSSTTVTEPASPTAHTQSVDDLQLTRTNSSPIFTSSQPPSVDYYTTLSFALTFLDENDTVYLSHCYPYTYTYLKHRLQHFQSRCLTSLVRQPLCYTRLGNLGELVTITDTQSVAVPVAERPIIFLSCRVHPGETNSSWAIDGFLDWLTADSLEARALRSLAVIKLVPMLNIDGVVEGNYRTNLTGTDLNRVWLKTSADSHPTIEATKKLLFSLKKENRKLLLFVDWHGHSTMSSTGLYGCSNNSKMKQRQPIDNSESQFEHEQWSDILASSVDLPLRERLFPMLLARRAPDVFNYDECTYNISEGKAGSARVVVWQSLRLHASYTLETSFFGQDFGRLNGLHFNAQHFRDVGRGFGLACFDLLNADKTRVKAAVKSIKENLKSGKKSKNAA